ncbi:hypothetical protein PCASD_13132 [Puccinia coronata f. sp. avenae]|uniref:Uncharacterized protein n=1 Tax=Puccinia coronata f. sp. avenae TaxID=200324 RepID=A0A2N5UDA5_9BASI|nr:hypothetical protein PCASD_13132 [Puccinia coronata f. sp. avenae]
MKAIEEDGEEEFNVIPKIRRVPKKIKGSLRELLDRERQFEIAVLANPQAGSTEDERRSYLIRSWGTVENQKKLKLFEKDSLKLLDYAKELETHLKGLEERGS